MDIEEHLKQARDELKRADHLIYVSLKYTRTCDVFKNCIARLIDAIDFSLTAMLIQLEEAGTITEIPQQARLRAELVKQQVHDDRILKLIEFYLFLRQVNRAEFDRAREYRRHVTMTCKVEGENVEITIDNITQYYKEIRDDLAYVEKYVKGTL